MIPIWKAAGQKADGHKALGLYTYFTLERHLRIHYFLLQLFTYFGEFKNLMEKDTVLITDVPIARDKMLNKLRELRVGYGSETWRMDLTQLYSRHR